MRVNLFWAVSSVPGWLICYEPDTNGLWLLTQTAAGLYLMPCIKSITA